VYNLYMSRGRQRENLEGQRFGKLTVVCFDRVNSSGRVVWLCLCDCGNEKLVTASHLKSDNTRSCGCLFKELSRSGRANLVHGHARAGQISPTYISWYGMLARCNNINHSAYKSYGGKGIKVCARRHSFANFLEDMGERPEGTTIDRSDKNGNYELSNCWWAPKEWQQFNTSRQPLYKTL
jgi:hypothetical protein